MTWWAANITQNPLLVEARRFWRKFIGASKNKRTNTALLILIGIIYLTIVAIAIANADSLTAEHIFVFQSFLFCFIVPALTFGAIAGERERRSWDMLIVAPITKSQIVIGKFLSAASVVLCVAGAMLPIAIICSLGKESFGFHDQLWTVLASESASLGFGIAFCALGIFISSLMNRAFSAQATIYGVLFVWMILWPMLVSLIPRMGDDNGFNEYLLWNHPFIVSFYVMGVDRKEAWLGTINHPGRAFYTAPAQLLFYGVTTIILLLLAIAAIRERKNRLAGNLNNA
jgi:ABC-type transport system involved in multi-copper enzyme maturation permease subunit